MRMTKKQKELAERRVERRAFVAERIHPESMRQLRELVKLHGCNAVAAAVEVIRETIWREE